MASNTNNVKLGTCRIYLDNVDLGYTQGGVEVEVSTDTHKVMVDQFGETEVNEYIMKRSCQVTVPLAETTIDNMIKIMPGASLVVDAVDPLIKRVDVTTGVGTSLLDGALKLVLRPIELDTATPDKSEDFVVPLAATSGALQFAYKVDEERVFNTVFTGYPDSATGKLFSFGDEDATE